MGLEVNEDCVIYYLYVLLQHLVNTVLCRIAANIMMCTL